MKRLDKYLNIIYMENYNPKHSYFNIWEVAYDTLGKIAPDAQLENEPHMKQKGAIDILKTTGEFIMNFSIDMIDQNNLDINKIQNAINEKLERISKYFECLIMKVKNDIPGHKIIYQIIIANVS